MLWKCVERFFASTRDKASIGTCEHCAHAFRYSLVHNGFNGSSYAYCDTCGCTALLSEWEVPNGVSVPPFAPISEEVESILLPCSCSGAFRSKASPRCPHCHRELSASRAADYIEAQAAGTAKGWRWQRSWDGVYCIIIENRVTRDNWKKPNA